MAQLTRDDVARLAHLARLSLTDAEIDEFRAELSTILQYVEKLDTADTAGLEPTSQVTGLHNVMRDDSVVDYGMSRDDLLRNAPQTQDGLLKVRRMIG